jgi:hypothetical protein
MVVVHRLLRFGLGVPRPHGPVVAEVAPVCTPTPPGHVDMALPHHREMIADAPDNERIPGAVQLPDLLSASEPRRAVSQGLLGAKDPSASRVDLGPPG